ncbi:MAG TPA: DUF4254 domain-containing protein [Acidobacteriaceae bacterium]|jgi:hypothetical protein
MPISLSTLVDACAIVQLQDGRTRLWHQRPAEPPEDRTVDGLVEAQHAANFALWHAEDEARRSSAGDAAIAAVKREIDRVNQLRNDTTEGIDALLLASLRDAGIKPAGEQHSETPGMMIDRLSILSLKLFHTEKELDRIGAPAGHRERNMERFATLQEQRDDLARCLERLWAQVCAGERCFKQYRQLKMYNDAELNPVLYQRNAGKTRL